MASVAMIEQRDAYWKEYNLHVELYKYHMDIALRTNLFFYGITGGIVTYYLKYPSWTLRLGLVLPGLMSLILCYSFTYAGWLSKRRGEQMDALAAKLILINDAPNIRILHRVLWAFAGLFFLVMVGMILLLCIPLEQYGRVS